MWCMLNRLKYVFTVLWNSNLFLGGHCLQISLKKNRQNDLTQVTISTIQDVLKQLTVIELIQRFPSRIQHENSLSQKPVLIQYIQFTYFQALPPRHAILSHTIRFHSVHNSLSNLQNYEQIYVIGYVGYKNTSLMHFILVMWVKYELTIGEAQIQYYDIS
jgi:hypothetical protein